MRSLLLLIFLRQERQPILFPFMGGKSPNPRGSLRSNSVIPLCGGGCMLGIGRLENVDILEIHGRRTAASLKYDAMFLLAPNTPLFRPPWFLGSVMFRHFQLGSATSRLNNNSHRS